MGESHIRPKVEHQDRAILARLFIPVVDPTDAGPDKRAIDDATRGGGTA
jgi:hypothetical protein